MKGAHYPEYTLALWASRKIGRPVKWTASRAEGMLTDDQDRDLISEAALALDADGKFLAMELHNVAGVGAYLGILSKMLDEVEDHSFQILGRANADDACYLRWTFYARLRKSGTQLQIDGMSEIKVDERGQSSSHVDYWDPGLEIYDRLPLLGKVIGWARRRAVA